MCITYFNLHVCHAVYVTYSNKMSHMSANLISRKHCINIALRYLKIFTFCHQSTENTVQTSRDDFRRFLLFVTKVYFNIFSVTWQCLFLIYIIIKYIL